MKEAHLESDLDNGLFPFDDSHIYDEPSRCMQPLPLPPEYRNMPTPPDAPPSYSTTVRFLQSEPLANSTMMDSSMSTSSGGGVALTGGQNESNDYSELDTNAMPRLEYGNIGQSATSSEGSKLDANTTNYTDIASSSAEPNPYAELPDVAPTSSLATSAPTHDQTGDTMTQKTGTNGAAAVNCERPSDAPANRNSDYQPLLPQRSDGQASSGDYDYASPHHVRSGYDVPRRQSESLVSQREQSPRSVVFGAAAGDKEGYVNTTAQALSDMQEYVEMSSAHREE